MVMKKIAIISLGLPPSHSGQSMVLYHLFKESDPETFCLITQKNFYLYKNLGNCSEKLIAPHHFVNPDYQIIRILLTIASKLRLKTLLDLLLMFRIYQYKKILRSEQCSAVIGCTGDLVDPAAAFYASKDLKIPFIFYAFDYYSMQWSDPVLRSFAKRHEEILVKGAEGIIVPNECLEKEYRNRYGISSTLIHNPFDLVAYEKQISSTSPAKDPRKKKIVYTGAIYEAHYSAFRNLISAVKMTDISGLELHIYTPQSELRLTRNGIEGPVVLHKHLPNSLIPDIQRNADILFLPLAFGSDYPDIIRTSAPAKMGEYLASGCPVLVHAPQDSFVSWFFKKYQCGLVVDEDNPELLARAVIHLVNDDKLCQELTHNAYVVAKTDFDIKSIQKKFHDVLNGLENPLKRSH
jgi:glycosyltransferase involved in cell wall biosynthesis